MIANTQVQSFGLHHLSNLANSAIMAESDKNLIEQLIAHVGVTASEVARRAGLTPSTLTRPLNHPVKHRLSVPTLDKLKVAFPDFPNWSDPPPAPNARLGPPMEGASMERMQDDVPIVGSALGAVEVIDGEAIEQTYLNTGEVIAYAKRPVILGGRADVYQLIVQGSSMAPRHEEGDPLYVEARTARVGDDVVVYLRPTGVDDDDGERATAVYVKRLVRTTARYVELEQFQPPKVFRIERELVLKTHRVIPWRELLS